jgi:hypothetical protein
VALVAAGDFRLQGTPKIYVKTADSGMQRAQAFCPDCGTPLYATAAEPEPKIYNIRLGTARQRDVLQPRFQVWSRSALPWLGALGEVPARETQ